MGEMLAGLSFPAMKLWSIAVVLAACASTPPPAPPKPVVEVARPPSAPLASRPPPVADAAAPSPVSGCDEDSGPEPDCSGLRLGQCGAAEYYACPAKVGLPTEAGLRPKVAARVSACLARPSFDGTDSACIKTVEACVREAVAASCTEDSAVATCKRELGICSPEVQALCAKYLTSLAPKTRENALKDLKSQRKNKKACTFSWDLNGFPFCPYCPFQP